MKTSEKVNNFLSQLDTRIKDLERTDHIIKTAYGIISDNKTESKVLDFEDDEDIIDYCKGLDSRLQEIEHYRNPQMLHNKVQYQFELIEGLSNVIARQVQMFNALELDERFILIYTDDDIKRYYTLSGLTATDVKKFIDKIEKENIPMTTISEYVNAKIDDLKLRSIIGNYFKYEALKKTKKDNQPHQ